MPLRTHARPRPLLALPLALALATACGPGKRAEPPLAGSCEVRLDAPAPFVVPSVAPLVTPPSRVVVDAAVDIAAILGALDREVPRRVAEAHRMDIGAFGKLTYHVDRGAWAAGVRDGALHVETDLSGHGEACKPLGPFGCAEYASCDPAAHADAAIQLTLLPGYKLPGSRVSIPVTRPCQVTSLGLDVTGHIQREANAQADRLRRRIDAAIPPLGDRAGALWSSLGIVFPIGLTTCVRVRPTALVQGVAAMRDAKTAGVPLGVVGEVAVESPCGGPASPTPLPEPKVDGSLAPGVALDVPVGIAFEDVSVALARTIAPLDVDAGSERVRIADVRAGQGSGSLDLAVTLAGRACGAIHLGARPGFDPRSGGLVLTDVKPVAGEAERVRALAPGLDLAPVAAAVEARARIALPFDIAVLPRRIEQAVAVVAGQPPPRAPQPGGATEIVVHIDRAEVSGVAVGPGRVVAIVGVRGSAGVRVR